MTYQIFIDEYDKNFIQKRIAPIAHTKITADICILLDANGFKIAAEIHDRVIIPCTAESETRSSNVAPHLLHDKLSYVAEIEGYENRHDLYIAQLQNYVNATGNIIAKAILNYVSRNDILKDIKPVTDKINLPLHGLMVVFYVYPADDTIDLQWTKYYLSTLPKNGVCIITGMPDYIPNAYPANIRYPGDKAKLFVANPQAKQDHMGDLFPGYVASQKILHTMQVKCQGNEEEISRELSHPEFSNFCI